MTETEDNTKVHTKSELRNLGKSDIKITPIGLGAWQFSEGKAFNGMFWDPLDMETTNAIVKTSLDHGINWIDTAEYYGKGASERGVSKALQAAEKKAGDVKIATKWFPLFRFARNIPKTIHKRLENLNPYPIDLYQIHQPFSFSFTKTEMKYMAQIADQGLIKSIGISNYSANKMATAFEELEQLNYPLVSNQVKYSLLDRAMETNGTMDKAKDLGMTLIAYSPLEQGLLTGKFQDDPSLLDSRPFIRRRILKRKLESSRDLVDLLKQIAEEKQATPAQVALSWTINYNKHVVAIPGASKTSHAEHNAESMSVKLSKEQLNVIEEKSQLFL